MAATHHPHGFSPTGPEDGRPVVLDRREGPFGEVVLRRHGDLLQIIANGCFLMDTSDGRSERRLVRAAFDALDRGAGGGGRAPKLLIGGLGVGFSLAEAAAEPRWGGITVVEREAAVIDWHRTGPLARLTAEALADPRTELRHVDLLTHLRAAGDAAKDAAGDAPGGAAPYDALCLDIDNGPDWTVTQDNDALYSPAGLAACRSALAPGGVLAVWSAGPSPSFADALRNAGFHAVRTEAVPSAGGIPDVLFLASHHHASRCA